MKEKNISYQQVNNIPVSGELGTNERSWKEPWHQIQEPEICTEQLDQHLFHRKKKIP